MSSLPCKKICLTCNLERDYSEFYPDSNRRDGIRSHCKSCEKERNKLYHRINKDAISRRKKVYTDNTKDRRKQYLEQNKDRIQERTRKYYLKTKESKSHYLKQYYQDNKEKYKERHLLYQQSNKPKKRQYDEQYRKSKKSTIKEYHRKYYLDNKDKILERIKTYSKNNPDKLKEKNIRRRISHFNSEGTFTQKDIHNLLISQNFLCRYCSKNISDKYTIDHIIPLTQKGSNYLTNIALACKSCNSSKGNKLLETWKHTPYYKENCQGNILLRETGE